MKEPKIWRDTIDPFSLNYKNIKLLEILGYPHAGNDVFYAKAIYKEKEVYVYIKAVRKEDKNLKREIFILNELDIKYKPELLDYDEEGKFIVTLKIKGKRLSNIVNDNSNNESLKYLKEYGKTLAEVHKLNLYCEKVEDRKFFHIPSEEYCEKYGLVKCRKYLIDNEPKDINYCFCHGDMHYANVLWKNNHIEGILDFELAGIGNKEFDIAWVLIRRPSQKFMKSEEEINEFLKGYSSCNNLNYDYVKYYMILIYMYFYEIGIKDDEYKKYVYDWLNKNCTHIVD